MYFNDESLAEIGGYYEMPEPPNEHEVSEADYHEKDRAVDQQQADCPHIDTTEEHGPHIERSGAVELVLVCHDCGAVKPLGKWDSIL